MANLFRCGGGSSKVEEPTIYFISKIECAPNSGGNYARTLLPIPDDVKTIKVGRAYKTGSYTGSFTVYSTGGANQNINYNLNTVSNATVDIVIDVSGRKSDTLIMYSHGNESQSGSTILENVEFIF